MGTGALVSVEEYLHSSYSPDCEFVEGQLLERHVGEKEHSKLQRALIEYLARYRKMDLHAWPEQRVQVKADRYRIPDVCITEGEPAGQIFTSPPLVCIEILSPDDSLASMQIKVQDYLLFGVPYVWLLIPSTREAHIGSWTGPIRVTDGILRTVPPHRDVTIHLEDLFRP